ncbi:uncharacterized protein LOC111334617 isoform X2 [Stylophora pistillata]|uniref:uncharacterized protein LOC111334617 isoform X2 n=1 Tax=Stylophora pistillata TaxID=50429 RepID=UPI000C03A01F|nr:uncharacterized protein LOC111334617 isoform X2 [Stylophora pistillata]
MTEVSGIICFTCDEGSDCRKHTGEEICPVEPLLKDRCIEIMNNENGQVAKGWANIKMCQTAEKSCRKAKETRTGDCDVTCCTADLCNAGSKGSSSLWLHALCFLFYVLFTDFLNIDITNKKI